MIGGPNSGETIIEKVNKVAFGTRSGGYQKRRSLPDKGTAKGIDLFISCHSSRRDQASQLKRIQVTPRDRF